MIELVRTYAVPLMAFPSEQVMFAGTDEKSKLSVGIVTTLCSRSILIDSDVPDSPCGPGSPCSPCGPGSPC